MLDIARVISWTSMFPAQVFLNPALRRARPTRRLDKDPPPSVWAAFVGANATGNARQFEPFDVTDETNRRAIRINSLDCAPQLQSPIK
jgi:hypothetical protein